MEWSHYQKAIFKEVSKGSSNIIIEAVAGSGKTSSLLKSLEYLPSDKSWLLVAFNKKIAEELKRRAPNGNGEAKTLHSLGLRAVFNRLPKTRIEQNKVKLLLNKIVGKDKNLWELKDQINKTVTLCKGYLISGDEFIDIIMDNHDIDTCNIDRDSFINFVQKTMDACREETKMIDFSDMIWFPYVFDLPVQKYDTVIIDECQDLNNAEMNLAIKASTPGGRIFVYGDQKQALYNFKGAAANAMDKMKQQLNAKSLPLSITYRCPNLVVKEAQKYVPYIEARPNAPDGSVEFISHKEMLKLAKPGCFILSRINAPLIGLALSFIKNGIPANIQGRDIGQNLLTIIKKSRKASISTFLTWLDSWESKETKRLRKKHGNTDLITDKAGCLRALADACSSMAEIKEKIKYLFEDTDEHGKIVLSSVHRAKGAERDVVFLLNNTFREFNQEEKNIKYVAITRAIASLYYVS